MTAEKTTIAFGWRVYGLGVMAVGILILAFGEFDPGQPVPKGFPARAALAYAAGALMVVAGAAVEWRRTAAWGAAALTAYYALVVVLLMNGRLLLIHYAEYVTYESTAEQLAITAGALIVFATFARADALIDAVLAARLTRVGQIMFGVCALVFGGAHFADLKFTASLVPKWLPPSQQFWVVATAIGFLAAGVALLTGVKARLAAMLLTGMLVSFALLIHEPMLLANHHSHENWTESAVNLAVMAGAWVVTDSLAQSRLS
jgi:uncharacterized membrane protein YphA (DoxX/SURF4 family)